MINNNICKNCQHILVCSKQLTLDKFNSEGKKYIDMDITIDKCKDYMEIPEE